jgi:hypothetical protein
MPRRLLVKSTPRTEALGADTKPNERTQELPGNVRLINTAIAVLTSTAIAKQGRLIG